MADQYTAVSVNGTQDDGIKSDLEEGAKAASAACNLQYFGASAFRQAAPHEVCQGDHGRPLHGILPSNEQRLRRCLVHTGRLV